MRRGQRNNLLLDVGEFVPEPLILGLQIRDFRLRCNRTLRQRIGLRLRAFEQCRCTGRIRDLSLRFALRLGGNQQPLTRSNGSFRIAAQLKTESANLVPITNRMPEIQLRLTWLRRNLDVFLILPILALNRVIANRVDDDVTRAPLVLLMNRVGILRVMQRMQDIWQIRITREKRDGHLRTRYIGHMKAALPFPRERLAESQQTAIQTRDAFLPVIVELNDIFAVRIDVRTAITFRRRNRSGYRALDARPFRLTQRHPIQAIGRHRGKFDLISLRA